MSTKGIYLAGPITGLIAEGKVPEEIFQKAENEILAKCGSDWRVINPCAFIEAQEMVNQWDIPHKLAHKLCLTRDINVIMNHMVDAVVVLPGWETSKGTKFELYAAKFCGIPVYSFSDFLRGNPEPLELECIVYDVNHSQDYGQARSSKD